MTWARPSQQPDEVHANELIMINEHLAAERAWLRENDVNDPVIIAKKLLPIDQMLETWSNCAPDNWIPVTYDVRSLVPGSEPGLNANFYAASPRYAERDDCSYDGQWDLYEDLWIASVWNNYRGSRIIIHESILAATISTMKTDTLTEDLIKTIMDESVRVLGEMMAGICRSIYFHMSSRSAHAPFLDSYPPSRSSYPTIPADTTEMSGTYLVIWPLYMAGLLRTTPPDQRSWIADKLEDIGRAVGNKQALTLSAALREVKNETFINTKEWEYGEAMVHEGRGISPVEGTIGTKVHYQCV